MLHNAQKFIIMMLVAALFINFAGYYHWWYQQDSIGSWSGFVSKVLRVINPVQGEVEPAFRSSDFHLSETTVIYGCFIVSAFLSFVSAVLVIIYKIYSGRTSLFASLFVFSITLFGSAVYVLFKTVFYSNL